MISQLLLIIFCKGREGVGTCIHSLPSPDKPLPTVGENMLGHRLPNGVVAAVQGKHLAFPRYHAADPHDHETRSVVTSQH